jgi:hypothetical protein
MARKRIWGYGEPRGTQALVDFLLADVRRQESCPRHGYPIDPVIGGCSECLAELRNDPPTCPDCGRVVPPEPYTDPNLCIVCKVKRDTNGEKIT